MNDKLTFSKVLCFISLGLLLQGCQPSDYLTMGLIEPEPLLTEEGVMLHTVFSKTVAYKEVIERSPNIKGVSRITENEDRNVVIGPPVLSPTEPILIYSQMLLSDKNSGSVSKLYNSVKKKYKSGIPLAYQSSIYKQNIGTPGKTRITYGNRTDLCPAFSPDGRKILFCSNRTGPNPTLWQINISGGGGITKLTNTYSEDYAPCFAQDKSLIAYTSHPPGAESPQVWTVSPVGLLPTQLREGQSPQISPDSSRILFVRSDKDSGKSQLWLMNIDGTEETQLTTNRDYDIKDARWSFDGQKIVYASNEGVDSHKKHNFDIWMMDADGTNSTQLTTNGSHDDCPFWDYYGMYIYFRSNRGGSWNIWRFEPIVP
ncbi:MAG: PD40 domain-containing protein [Sedimentisphaerales bacterium]|nr:PD40 domain-containing protein [Sedimentisphaerales bacterium]